MIAKKAVDEAFSSMDPMDDESFEDAMESKCPLSLRGEVCVDET